MKNIIILNVVTLIFTINVSAQSLMTNTINNINFKQSDIFNNAIVKISRAYNVRICVENKMYSERQKLTRNEMDNLSLYYHTMPMAFTNATLETVFDAILHTTTNHVWRYDNNTGTIYIYPETNTVSMIKIGPVCITNAPAKHFHNRNDMLGLKQYNFKHNYGRSNEILDDVKINLEFEEAYVWEVFDMVCEQMPNKTGWIINESFDPEIGKIYWFEFYDKNFP